MFPFLFSWVWIPLSAIFFFICFQIHPNTILIFNCKKKRFFLTKFRVFWLVGSFSQNKPVFRCNWSKSFFSQFFSKNSEIFFGFPKKPKKSLLNLLKNPTININIWIFPPLVSISRYPSFSGVKNSNFISKVLLLEHFVLWSPNWGNAKKCI